MRGEEVSPGRNSKGECTRYPATAAERLLIRGLAAQEIYDSTEKEYVGVSFGRD